MHFPSSRRLSLTLGVLVTVRSLLEGAPAPRVAPIPDQVIVSGQGKLYVPFTVLNPTTEMQVGVSVARRGTPLVTYQTVLAGTNGYIALTMLRQFSDPVLQNTGVMGVTLTVTAQSTNPPHAVTVTSTSFQVTALPREIGASFLTVEGVSTGRAGSGVAADLNADGIPELMILDGQTRNLLVFQGEGAGFGQDQVSAAAPDALVQRPFTVVAPMDVNGDGLPDIMTIDASGRARLFLQTGKQAPMFAVRTNATFPTTGAAAVAFIDINRDGLPDLLIASTNPEGGTPSIGRWINQGPDGFVPFPDAGDFPAAAGPFVVADFDGDGMDDLVIANVRPTGSATNPPSNILLLGRGDGTFTPSGAQLPAGVVAHAGWTDLNGDGAPDLWMEFRAAGANPPVLSLLEQHDGAFVELQRIPLPIPPGYSPAGDVGVAFGDFNNDGRVEFIAPVSGTNLAPSLGSSGVLSVRAETHLAIWRRNAANQYEPYAPIPDVNGAQHFSAVVAADFNGDGSLDLATLGSTPQPGSILLNRAAMPSLPPGAPPGLSASVFGMRVFLSWEDAADSQTSAPLTYNVRVGTRPGSGDLVPPMSRPDGIRLAPTPGNAGHRTFAWFDLSRADTTTVYWTVQAVDAAFNGGSFSPEQMFTLDSTEFTGPQITGLTDIALPVGNYTNITFHVSDPNAPAALLNVTAMSTNAALFPVGTLSVQNPAVPTDPGLRILRLWPSPGHRGDAYVTVTATDGYGLSASRTMHVGVPGLVRPGPAPNPPASLPTPSFRNGEWVFSLGAAPTAGWRLQKSTNLSSWEPVDAVFAPAGNGYEMHVGRDARSKVEFFRMVVPAPR
jgi:FG-GAP-like repeat